MFSRLVNLPPLLSMNKQGKVEMQRSVLLVIKSLNIENKSSNVAFIVSVAQYLCCCHLSSKVKEAIKRVEKEGLHPNVKKENERCLLTFLNIKNN